MEMVSGEESLFIYGCLFLSQPTVTPLNLCITGTDLECVMSVCCVQPVSVLLCPSLSLSLSGGEMCILIFILGI